MDTLSYTENGSGDNIFGFAQNNDIFVLEGDVAVLKDEVEILETNVANLQLKTTNISYSAGITTVTGVLAPNLIDYFNASSYGTGANSVVYSKGGPVRSTLTLPQLTIFGSQSGLNLSTGGGTHVIIGYNNAKFNNGWQNVLVGNNILTIGSVTNSYNSALGHSACSTISGGSNYNSALGYNAGNKAGVVTNCTFIGANAGTVGNPGSTYSSNALCLGDANTTVYTQNAIVPESDRRDKTDILELNINCLDMVNKMLPVKYRMNPRGRYFEEYLNEETGDLVRKLTENDGSKKDEKMSIGFIAQDMACLECQYLGECVNVHGHETDQLGLNYSGIIPILVGAIQQLTRKVDYLMSLNK